MRRAFVINTGADTAGTSVRLVQAFDRMSRAPIRTQGWQARSMVTAINYIDYPEDMPYSLDAMLANYAEADLVQLNSTMHGHGLYDRGQGKPTVLMHHGIHTDHFHKDIWGCVAEADEIGATQVGSTVNLELVGPVQWMPTPYDLPGLARLRQRLYQPHPRGLIRIGHAPTDRKVKSTEAVIAAVKSLEARGHKVQLVLIEGKTWAETMKLKARFVDVLVDQLGLGYGCNAIEAWALGIPVVGAVNDHPDWRAHMVKRYGLKESPSGLPMLETDEGHLEARLLDLVRSPALREEWAGIGLAHSRRWHSEEAVTAIVADIWDKAVRHKTKPGAIVRLFPGRSRTRRRAHPRDEAARRIRTPVVMRH